MRTRFAMQKRALSGRDSELKHALTYLQILNFMICACYGKRKRLRSQGRRESEVFAYGEDFRFAQMRTRFATQRRALSGLSPPTKEAPPRLRWCFFCWRRERDSNSRSVISRTHDFQSCALDQLSHLSVRLAYYTISIFKSQAFFSLFFKKLFLFF